MWLSKMLKLEKTVPIWEKEIFPCWEAKRKTHQLRHAWEEGIPRSIRGKVWFLALGNRGAITRDLFNIMAERGSKLKYLLKEHSIQEQLILECGVEVPLRKEEVFFPAMPETTAPADDAANANDDSIASSTNNERANHERKIKQL